VSAKGERRTPRARALISSPGCATVAVMNGARITRTRRIDSGEPLILWDPPEADGVAGYAVIPAICTNPQCPCTDIAFTIHHVKQLGDGSSEIQQPALAGEVSSDGTGVKIDQAAGRLTTEIITWIRHRLEQDNHRAWFHERWSRVRGQAGDPAYPSGAAPEGIDGMVPRTTLSTRVTRLKGWAASASDETMIPRVDRIYDEH
jgi:hypothetical protein